jgi:hypothetical protein
MSATHQHSNTLTEYLMSPPLSVGDDMGIAIAVMVVCEMLDSGHPVYRRSCDARIMIDYLRVNSMFFFDHDDTPASAAKLNDVNEVLLSFIL